MLEMPMGNALGSVDKAGSNILSKLFKRVGVWIGTALLCLLIGEVIIAPSPAVFKFHSRRVEKSQRENRVILSVEVVEEGDPYLTLRSPGCLLELKIDDTVIDAPYLPACSGRVVRRIAIPALRKGTFSITGTISGSSEFLVAPAPSPWRVAFQALCRYLLIFQLLWILSSVFPASLTSSAKRLWNLTIITAGGAISAFWGVSFLRHEASTSQGWFYPVLALAGIGLVWIRNLYGELSLPFSTKTMMQAPPEMISARMKYFRLAVLIAAFVYVVGMSMATIARHNDVRSQALDMALLENVIWNTAHGRWFLSSVNVNESYLATHTAIIYLLILPFYTLYPHTETLLVLQAFLLGAAALPLFELSTRMTRDPWVGLALAVSYLLNPLLQSGNYYDFHEFCFLPLLFFLAYWALVARRVWCFWGCVLLTALVKEDCSIVLALLGAVCLLDGDIRLGFRLLSFGALAYALLQGVIVTDATGSGGSYMFYFRKTFPNADTPVQAAINLLESPVEYVARALSRRKLEFLLLLFGPLLFLPLMTLQGAVLSAYGLGLILLGTQWALFTRGFHYSFLYLPPAYCAAVTWLARRGGTVIPFLRMQCRRILAASIVSATFLVFILYGAPYAAWGFKGGFERYGSAFPSTNRAELAREVREAAGMLPADAGVVADERLAPHFADRRYIVPLRFFDSRLERQYSYCIAERLSPTSTCQSLGCFGVNVAPEFRRLLICSSKG